MQIKDFDLEPIIVKLVDQDEGLGWTLEYANRVDGEYRKFLEICKMHPDSPIVPSSPVDDFWHYHILDTQKYQNDCYEYFGYFLHHFPYFGMRGKEDEENLKSAWFSTLKIYRDMFGDPDQSIWQSSKRCPNCGRRSHDGSTSEIRPRLADIGVHVVLESI